MTPSSYLPLRPDARWHRADTWLWQIEARSTEWGWLEHVVTLADWEALEPYQPLRDKSDAYLAFAMLRSDIWAQAPRTLPIEEQWDKLRPFLGQYGPPLDWMDRMTVEEAMEEARQMAIALCCYQCLAADASDHRSELRVYLNNLRGQGEKLCSHSPKGYIGLNGRDLASVADLRTDQGLVKAARAYLEDALNSSPNGLIGVRMQVSWDPDCGWHPTYRFNVLANALWFQLYHAALRHSSVRLCAGCGEPFEAERPNQFYHDTYCRGAANAKRTYHRKRGGTKP